MPRLRNRFHRAAVATPALVALGVPGALGSDGPDPATPDPCRDAAAPTVVRLAADDVVAEARALAADNWAAIAAIDARLRSGALGAPGSRAARRRARELALLRLRNVYHLLFRYAADPDRVYEADAGAFEHLLIHFADSGLFPIARLERVRLGRGQVCVRYDLDEPGHGWTPLGGRVVRYRVGDEEVDGRRRRVLSVDWNSGSTGEIEVLIADHLHYSVEHRRPAGARPYELFLARDLEGTWIRRRGVHRPTAFMFWTSLREAAGPGAGTGVLLVIPSLRLHLPGPLPDIALDDRRRLALPAPLLEVRALRDGAVPEWLRGDAALELAEWEGLGTIPREIEQRFPDA